VDEGQRHSLRLEKTEDVVDDRDLAIEVLHVPILEYLPTLCRDTGHKVYRWAGISAVDKQTSLVLIVASLSFVVLCAVVLSLAGLAAGVLNLEAARSLAQDGRLLQDVGMSMTERTTTLIGDTQLAVLRQTAVSAAGVVRDAFLVHEGQAEASAALLLAQVDATDVRHHLRQQAALSLVVQDIAGAYATLNLPVADLSRVLRSWVAANATRRAAMVLDLPNQTPFSETALLTACVAAGTCGAALALAPVQQLFAAGVSVSNGTLHAQVALPAGLDVTSACAVVEAGKVGVCVFEDSDGITNAAIARMTASNELEATDSQHLDNCTLAYRPAGGGAAWVAPAAAYEPRWAAIDNRTDDQASYSAAVAGGGGVALMTGYARQTAAHARLEVLAVCEVFSNVTRAFMMARLAAQLAARASGYSVSVAYTDAATGDVALAGAAAAAAAGGAADTRYSPQVVLGAMGQAGLIRGVSGGGADVLAVYNYVPALRAALVVEFPLHTYEAEAVASFIEHVANIAATGDGQVLLVRDLASAELSYVRPPAGCAAGDAAAACLVPAEARRVFFSRQRETVAALRLGGGAFNCDVRYVFGLNMVLIVAQRSSLTLDKAVLVGVYCVLAGLALVLVTLVLIRAQTIYVLNRIQADYNTYKVQIEEEKFQFSELVKDAMPQIVQPRVLAGEVLIADNHQQLTFFFSDIVNCTEKCRNASTVDMVRLLGYTFMLQDCVAEHFGVHKLKTIGDAFFCVAGLEDMQRKKEGLPLPPPEENQVYRMVAFAVVVQQLLSPAYKHHPERTDCFLQSAGTDLGPRRMVSMQTGIHCGPAIAGVVDVGRAPHFDCFGPSVNLASRMETTAIIDRLQISAVTMDLLKGLDKDNTFTFDPPKRVLIKGYGTMGTYTIKTSTLPVPEAVMAALHVERASVLRFFSETGLVIRGDANGPASSADPTNASSLGGQEQTTPKARSGANSSVGGDGLAIFPVVSTDNMEGTL
jgi:class 3 adenylate cyclase